MTANTPTATFTNAVHWRGFLVLILILLLISCTLFAVGRFAVSQGDVGLGRVFAFLAACMFVFAITQAVIVPRIRYEITSTGFRIRHGKVLSLRAEIPLANVQGLTPLKSFIVPSCVPNGFRLEYRKTNGKRSFLVITPVEGDQFLRELNRVAPHLMLAKDGLVRAAVVHYVN